MVTWYGSEGEPCLLPRSTGVCLHPTFCPSCNSGLSGTDGAHLKCAFVLQLATYLCNTTSYRWPAMQYYLTGTDAAWLDLARSLLAPPHIHSGFLPTFLLVPSPCSTLSKADYGHVRPEQVWLRVILHNLCHTPQVWRAIYVHVEQYFRAPSFLHYSCSAVR